MVTHEHGSVLLGEFIKRLKAKGGSQGSFGAQVGRTQQTISRYISGEDQPEDFESQLIIEIATNGEVPVESWLTPQLRARFERWLSKKARAVAAPKSRRARAA